MFQGLLDKLTGKINMLATSADAPVKYLSKEELIPYLQDFMTELRALCAHVQKAGLANIQQALEITVIVFEEFAAYVAAKDNYLSCPINSTYGLPSAGSFIADLSSHFQDESRRRKFDERINRLTQNDADRRMRITFFEKHRQFIIDFGQKRIYLIYRPAEKEIELEVGR